MADQVVLSAARIVVPFQRIRNGRVVPHFDPQGQPIDPALVLVVPLLGDDGEPRDLSEALAEAAGRAADEIAALPKRWAEEAVAGQTEKAAAVGKDGGGKRRRKDGHRR